MKMSELKELTVDELNKQERDLKEEMFNLRMQQSSEQLENTARIREVRRTIARIETLLTERAAQA